MISAAGAHWHKHARQWNFRRCALLQIDDLHPQQFNVFIRENGAGKTALLEG
jgi:recombinational DNA repair ATPase RecF